MAHARFGLHRYTERMKHAMFSPIFLFLITTSASSAVIAPAAARSIGSNIPVAPVSAPWSAALRGYFASPEASGSDLNPMTPSFRTMDLDSPQARLQLAPLAAMIAVQRPMGSISSDPEPAHYTPQTFAAESRYRQKSTVNHAFNLAVEQLSFRAFALIRASADPHSAQDALTSTINGLDDVRLFSAYLQPATLTAIDAAHALAARRLGAVKSEQAEQSIKATTAELGASTDEESGDAVRLLLVESQGQELKNYWGYDYKPRLVKAMAASIDENSSVRLRRAVAKELVLEIRRDDVREMHGTVAPEALASLLKGSSDDRLQLFAVKQIMHAISTRDWVQRYYARGVQAVEDISIRSNSEKVRAEAARLLEQERAGRAQRVYQAPLPPVGEQIRTGFRAYPVQAIVSLGALFLSTWSLPVDAAAMRFFLGALSFALVGFGLWNRRPGWTVGLSLAYAALLGWLL